nr:MAG TPA: hypothetical protein [Caudoviricetes sp.]
MNLFYEYESNSTRLILLDIRIKYLAAPSREELTITSLVGFFFKLVELQACSLECPYSNYNGD